MSPRIFRHDIGGRTTVYHNIREYCLALEFEYIALTDSDWIAPNCMWCFSIANNKLSSVKLSCTASSVITQVLRGSINLCAMFDNSAASILISSSLAFRIFFLAYSSGSCE